MENTGARLYKITLGNPVIGCKRYGICSIEESDYSMIPTQLIDNTVWAKIERKRDHLTIHFLRNSMTATTFKTHFSSGFFRIEQAIIYNQWHILKKNYPLQVFDNEWIIKIDPSVFYRFEGLQNTKYYLTDKALTFINSNPIS